MTFDDWIKQAWSDLPSHSVYTHAEIIAMGRMAWEAGRQARWVPVSESNPHERENYLITSRLQGGLLKVGGDLWDGEKWGRTAVAWANLPAPYKPEMKP